MNETALDLSHLRTTLDHLVSGFQLLSSDWVYLYVNPAAASHGRQKPTDLIGRRITDVYPGIEATPIFERLRRCLSDATRASIENRFEYHDGSSRWFSPLIQPVPQGLCIES